jgi:putative exosortase-associated protein (TIGR04073 family)
MRNKLFLLGSLALTVIMGVGCAGPEQKMGRGIANLTEVTRGGEFERSVEQEGIFKGTDVGFATGVVKGADHTLMRTLVGVYEVATAPLPPYGPVMTSYMSPRPDYPDFNRPRKWSDAMFDNDKYIGFSGGDVAPWFPGSHFRVFDN